MKKRMKQFSACLLILCCSIMLCYCSKPSEDCEIVAKKYIEASYNGDIKNLLYYSVAEIEQEAFVQACISVFDEIEPSDDLSKYLIATYGTDDYEQAYYKACNLVKNRFEEYDLNYSVIKCNHFGKDDSNKIVSVFNNEVNELLSICDAGYRIPVSALLIDPNEVESVCSVIVDVNGTSISDKYTESFELYVIKINGQWKVMESEVYGEFVDMIF